VEVERDARWSGVGGPVPLSTSRAEDPSFAPRKSSPWQASSGLTRRVVEAESARVKKFPPVALLLLAGLASCGRGAETAGSERLPRALGTEFPLRLAMHEGEFLLPAPPTRILPVNAAWIDYVSVLVAPERVVALPSEAFGFSRLSSAPAGWDELPSLAVFEAERVLALAPDLVLAHAWQAPETITTLRRAGIPVLVVPVPESWDEILATLALLGTVVGERERAQELGADLEARHAELARRAAPFAGIRALSYTNLGTGGWTCGARTTADVLLTLAGLRNAAAEAGLVGDVPADQERLLTLSPELFLVGRPDRSESSAPSATFLLENPVLASLPAVRARRIVALPPALFTSASPELLTGAERLIDELERLQATARSSDE
jgi:iron complex transport system substrate-binding protein